MANYVISNLSNDVSYNIYDKSRKDVNVVVKSILIRGGSNVIAKRGFQVSSQGVTTVVSDEDLKLLEQDAVFTMQRDKGFIRVVKGSQSQAESVSEKMDEKDNSAQLTPDDFKNRKFAGKKIPKPKLTIEEVESGEKDE